MRWRGVWLGSCLVVATLFGSCGSGNKATTDEDASLKVIPLVARKWSFDPPTINLKNGEPVNLEITSADVHHGFNLTAFGVRADLVPGQKVRLKVTPDKTGTFEFHCDYYCGSGHEGMGGQVVVE